MMTKQSHLIIVVFVLSTLLLSCCPFNQKALDLAETCKEESVSLMRRAPEPYTSHAAEVERQLAKIDEAIEHNEGRPCGTIVNMWKSIRDDEGGIVSFLKLWEDEGTLHPETIELFVSKIEIHYDEIIKTENDKKN